MHCHNNTEGSLPLHEGILRAFSRDLGKDSPKNLMTEEFIMLSYLLRLYNTKPNNVFTEAGSEFRHWLFLSLSWPVFRWDTCAQPQSKQRQMAWLIIQNRRSLGVSMFRCSCRAAQYLLATGTDLKRRLVKAWARAKILNAPFEQLWFDMKAGRKNAWVILIPI